jgi:Tfp pilus assembly protein PilV
MNYMNHSNHSQKKSGQTLVEVMVALFVLTVGMLGIIELLSQSLYISKNVGTETTATYLAAEGIELSENIIEHDVYQHLDCAIEGPGWGSAFQINHNYQLDYTTCTNLTSQATTCTVNTYNPSDPLLFDAATGLYSYEAGTPTPFTREISITSNDPGKEFAVQSKVTWNVNASPQSVILEDHFYYWQPPNVCP